MLYFDEHAAPEAVLDQILDDLAELALAHWPRWYGYEAPTTGSVVTHATSIEQVSRPWLCAAVANRAFRSGGADWPTWSR
jgi:hypothetical protein